MAKLSVLAGATSVSVNIFVQDSSSTTGGGLTGLVFNTSSLTAYYDLPRASAVAITLATLAAVTSAYSSGGFKEIDATNMPGWYRFDIPDAALASGRFVAIHFKGAANMAPCPLEIELTAVNNQSATAFITGVNSLAPPANWNLDSIDSNGRRDVIKVAGTTQTARDLGTSVLISSGTGTGQLDVTSGVIKANLAQILATALTETSGQIAAAFKQFFDVGSPTGTMKAITAVGTLTTYTGNTVQTGDAYARLGAPAGASTAADIAAIKAETALIKADTAPLRTNTAAAGGFNTITLDASASAVDNFYKWCWVRIRSGTGAGQNPVQINDYVGSTKVATVHSPWRTAPDNTSVFEVYGSNGKLDSSQQSYVSNGTGTGQISLSSGTVTAGTVSDKTGYGLSSAAVQAIWDALTSALTTSGSIGKWVLDKLDIVLSTVYSRVGAPVGASISADLAAAKADTAAIKINTTPQDAGTAQAGSSTTLTLRSGASAVDNYYKWCWVRIVGGTGAGQAPVQINDYVGTTKVATVVSPFRTTPDNTSVYEVLGAAAKIDSSQQSYISNGTGAGQVSLSSGLVTAGTVSDKTGYALSQTFPSNFASMAIDGSGRVTLVPLQIQLKKNTAFAGFMFFMVDSGDHLTGKTGLTVTATRSLAGASFGACSNPVTEVSNGWYTIDLAAGDLNANCVGLKFTATGADTCNITAFTQS